MAKAFAKTYSNGYTDEFRATDWAAAGNGGYVPGTRYFVRGKEVSWEEFDSAVDAARNAWWDKKESTHKKISVQHGVLPTSRVSIWVRK